MCTYMRQEVELNSMNKLDITKQPVVCHIAFLWLMLKMGWKFSMIEKKKHPECFWTYIN